MQFIYYMFHGRSTKQKRVGEEDQAVEAKPRN